jgi:hypothetical protein
MLSQDYIPIGKLKQAYMLSDNDVAELMAELLPNHVFPYVLWKNAYIDFWQWSVRECTQRYQVQEPVFPDVEALPEKYFPTSLYSMRIKRFFIDISRIIKISELEKGTDYIIEATYGENWFPFKEEKAAFFYALRQEENSLENWQRTSGLLKINSMEAAGDCHIPHWFFDTVIVDKPTAIIYLNDSGYKLEHEVKGITHSLVTSIINSPPQETPPTPETIAPAKPAAEDQSQAQKPVIRVPTSLWEGKPNAAVRDAMKADYRLSTIAYVLLNWCEVNKTQVGRLLSEKEYKEEKSYRNFVDDLLKKADAYTIIKA